MDFLLEKVYFHSHVSLPEAMIFWYFLVHPPKFDSEKSPWTVMVGFPTLRLPKVGNHRSFSGATVDGRNPAPADMVNIPLFTGFYTSQVVQDFLHPQYVKRGVYSLLMARVWKYPSPLPHLGNASVLAMPQPLRPLFGGRFFFKNLKNGLGVHGNRNHPYWIEILLKQKV